LAVSVGYLDLLEEHPAVAKDKILSENVAKIKRAHARVQERLDEFLSKAALELGRIELKPRRLNLLKLVEEAVQSCSSLAEAKQQQLLLQASAASIWLKADYHRLFEVVENLLSNAIKYSAPGQSIEIRVEEAAAGVRFSVQDQGPGFTPSDKEKAFAYFQRLSARPTGGEASVGVGLAVSKQIVELHQGRIWLESEVGQGTTFIVELPA
ncbi:MAG TPA: HAMP domain-containing sensor histidine kinase, partial [Candidatus Obscuribacterales bacterium]